MDIGLLTSVVSIPVIGALGTVAWRIQATITARKQSEIDSLKTEIESIRNIHSEQMSLMKEKNDLSVEQIETIVNTRAKEISTSIETTYSGTIRKWKSYGIVGITSAIGEKLDSMKISSISIWGHTPHYLQVTHNPILSFAIMKKLNDILNLNVNFDKISKRSEEFKSSLNLALEASPFLPLKLLRSNLDLNSEETTSDNDFFFDIY